MKISHALRLVYRPGEPHVISFVGAGGKSSALFRLAQELAERNLRVVSATTTRLAASQIDQAPAALQIQGSNAPMAEIERLLDRHGQCLLLGRPHSPRAEAGKLAGIQPQVIDHLVENGGEVLLGGRCVGLGGSRRRHDLVVDKDGKLSKKNEAKIVANERAKKLKIRRREANEAR